MTTSTPTNRMKGWLRSGLLQRMVVVMMAVLSTWNVFGTGAAIADLFSRLADHPQQGS